MSYHRGNTVVPSPYWRLFALKLSASIVLSVAGFVLLRYILVSFAGIRVTIDATLIGGFFLLPLFTALLFHVCFADQRLRCRTCGRRLRMPVVQGSWSALLLDTPQTEYVCPFGHGKLRDEVSISQRPVPVWTRYGDIWTELFRSPKN